MNNKIKEMLEKFVATSELDGNKMLQVFNELDDDSKDELRDLNLKSVIFYRDDIIDGLSNIVEIRILAAKILRNEKNDYAQNIAKRRSAITDFNSYMYAR
jgi:hypothetical protein